MTRAFRISLVATVIGLAGLHVMAASIFDLGSGPGASATSRPSQVTRLAWHDPATLPPWDTMTRGVFRLTGGGAVMRNARPAMHGVNEPATQPSQYPALTTRADIDLYMEIYSAREREAGGHADEVASLVKTLVRASHYTTSNSTYKRYLLLRAFALAQSADGNLDLLRAVDRELAPLLVALSPTMLAQRAELAQAMDQKAAGEGASDAMEMNARVVSALGELAWWQIHRGYLAEARLNLDAAEQLANVGKSDNRKKLVGQLRVQLAGASTQQEAYRELARRFEKNPDDARLNGQLAWFYLCDAVDVEKAKTHAQKSDEPLLQALAKATWAGKVDRPGTEGMALAALAASAPAIRAEVIAALAESRLAALCEQKKAASAEFDGAQKALLEMTEILRAAGKSAGELSWPTDRSSWRPALSVIYVCDCSGSMLTRFDELRQEVVAGVKGLTAEQSFNVIFMGMNQAKALNDDRLIPVTAEAKAKAENWVEGLSPRGQTEPITAMDIAFRQHPDVIFLLTDGDFNDNELVVKWIGEHNKDLRIRINTVAMITSPSENPEKVLTKIADDNGGTYQAWKEP